jgi:anti-sigma regulatory factor (Ser/Thr protein kinase)
MTSVTVPHAPRSAAEVRHELIIDLTTREVSPAVVDDAALVVSELVGNAVRYGSPLPDGGLRIRWELGERALRLEVYQGGVGPAQRGAGDTPMPTSAESGRGLAIVGMLAQRWGVTCSQWGGVGVYADLEVGEGGEFGEAGTVGRVGVG